MVDKSFHISHAALELAATCPAVAIHVVVNKNDYIICHLDYHKGIIQHSLDLDISEGEEITVYVENVLNKNSQSAIVHLTGVSIWNFHQIRSCYLGSYVEETVDNSWENANLGYMENEVY